MEGGMGERERESGEVYRVRLGFVRNILGTVTVF